MFREFFCGCHRRTVFAWLGLLVFVGHQAFKAWLKAFRAQGLQVA